jgi:hypothetical protein
MFDIFHSIWFLWVPLCEFDDKVYSKISRRNRFCSLSSFGPYFTWKCIWDLTQFSIDLVYILRNNEDRCSYVWVMRFLFLGFGNSGMYSCVVSRHCFVFEVNEVRSVRRNIAPYLINRPVHTPDWSTWDGTRKQDLAGERQFGIHRWCWEGRVNTNLAYMRWVWGCVAWVLGYYVIRVHGKCCGCSRT